MAADLEMTDAEFQTALRKISFVGVVALDEVFRGGDRSDRSTLGETLPDSTAGPMDTFEVKETKEALIQAVSQMAEREKTVLTLYYYEGLTLAEIGDILGRDREPGVPDPHQGGAAAAGQAGRPARGGRPAAGGAGQASGPRRQGAARPAAAEDGSAGHGRRLSAPPARRPAPRARPARVERPGRGTTMDGPRQPAGTRAVSIAAPGRVHGRPSSGVLWSG